MCKVNDRRKIFFSRLGVTTACRRTAWSMVVFCLLLTVLRTPLPASAAPLTDLGTDSPAVSTDFGLKDGSLAWGDYDNDGDLDLLVTGNNLTGGSETSIITNDNGTMVRHSMDLYGVQSSSGAWGDFDNDGYLDILITGLRSIGETRELFSGVYRNVASGSPPGRGFTLFQTLDPIYNGEGAWGDYNQDGFLDILLTGNTASDGPFTRVYRYTGSTFNNSGTTITALTNSSAAWADFDNDDDLDFAISGKTLAGTPATLVYRNNGESNFNLLASLPIGLYSGTVNWIDTDNDGFLELLVTGNNGAESGPNVDPYTLLYRYDNLSTSFTQINNPGLDDIWSSTVSVGDYNNDGLADLAMAGLTYTGRLVKIYTSDGDGTFTDAGVNLPEASGLSMAWGDLNQNGTLDLAVSGIYGVTGSPPVEHYYLNVYGNDSPAPPANTTPSAPTLDSACWDGSSTLTLTWNAASDDHTKANALTYTLAMGMTPGGIDRVSPGFLPGAGAPPPLTGNTYTGTRAILRYLPEADYYWAVQAVDASYAGSPFASIPGGVISYRRPVAVADSFTVDEDSTNTMLNILGNDEGNGEAVSLYNFTGPGHGTLSLVGGTLSYTPTANYNGYDSFYYYAIRESSKYCSRAQVTIEVRQVNDTPTGIALTNNRIAAGSAIGTDIGRFITTDSDSGQSYTYELVDETNQYDNEYFSLYRNMSYNPPATFLRTAAEMPPIADDMEYQIQVRSTDNGSPAASVTAVLLIRVIPSSPATNIALFDDRILENQAANASVGRVRTYMGTTEDTASTYMLVADEFGDNYDNDLFTIQGSSSTYYLRAIDALDFDELVPENNVYQVRIRSSNPAIRPPFEMVLNVYVDPTLPVVSAYDDNNVLQTGTVNLSASEDTPKVITLRTAEAGVGEVISWQVTSGPSHGVAVLEPGDTTNNQNKTLTYTPASDWFGSDSFVVQVNDPDGNTSQITVNLSVQNVNDPPTLASLGPVSYPELSGPHVIQLTGITAGPANEADSTPMLTVTAIRPWYAPDPWPFLNYETSAVVGGQATLTLYVGVGPGTYPMKVVVSDGGSQTSQDIQITVVFADKEQTFLPIVIR